MKRCKKSIKKGGKYSKDGKRERKKISLNTQTSRHPQKYTKLLNKIKMTNY